MSNFFQIGKEVKVIPNIVIFFNMLIEVLTCELLEDIFHLPTPLRLKVSRSILQIKHEEALATLDSVLTSLSSV